MNQKNVYQCKYCQKEFHDAGNCRKHELHKHEQIAETYICEFCQKPFTAEGIKFHQQRCELNPNKILTEKQKLAMEQKAF